MNREPNRYRILLIGHGSRSEWWNDAFRFFCQEVQQWIVPGMPFDKVDCCFLEYGEPLIPERIQRFCQEENSDLLALPLFLSVSHHVQEDIPRQIAQVATLEFTAETYRRYRRMDRGIYLIAPLDVADVLARNLARRYRQRSVRKPAQILLIFYGTKRYLDEWKRLAEATVSHLATELPGIKADYAFAGEATDFDPGALADRIQQMDDREKNVLLLPVLVAEGVIQKTVIPDAIERCKMGDRVQYFGDAILPDPVLAQQVLSYLGTWCEEMGES